MSRRSRILEQIGTGLDAAALALVRDMRNGGPPAYLFTSARGGEGTTTVVWGVASRLVNGHRMTPLIVEMDGRQGGREGGIVRYPGQAPQPNADPGKASGDDRIVRHPSGALVLPAEGNPHGSAVARDWGALLARIPDRTGAYDVLLVDAPPVLDNPGVLAAGEAIPKAILTVEAGETDIEVLRRAKLELERSGIRIVGAVLNKQRHYIPDWFYNLFIRRVP